MISKKAYLKSFFVVFCVLAAFQLSNVWGIDCSPKYSPSGQIKKVDAQDLTLDIVVEDTREDKEKYFFAWVMGWKSWDPDATKFNRGQKLFLTSTPKDIIKESLSESFFNAGYKITDQKENVILRCTLNKFLYTLDTIKYGQIGFAEITVNVSIEKNGSDCFSKEFHSRIENHFDAFHQLEDAEPILSKCLSKLVEDVAMDKNLRLAMSNRMDRTSLISSAPAANRISNNAPDSNFVIGVIKELPHQFPKGDVKGVWLSSVPVQLDVFAFPKGYNGKFVVFSSWVRNKKAAPYYLGKTPLLAKLRNGTYDIVFVHPPIEKEDYTIQYRTRRSPYSTIEVSEPLSPFIGQKMPAVYAVKGVLYFAEQREIEVSNENAFDTAIALFQREDQTIDNMLDIAPKDGFFKFDSIGLLKDPNQLVTRINDAKGNDTDNFSSNELKEVLSFSLTQQEAADAKRMLNRTGVWAKVFGNDRCFTVEVKPNDKDWFELNYPVTDNGRKGRSRTGFLVEETLDSNTATSQKAISTLPLKPQTAVEPIKESNITVTTDSTPTKILAQGSENKNPYEKLLPDFKEELGGRNPVRVRNPNNFSVTTGIRLGERGKNLNVPANGVQTVYVSNGRYDIFFVYSDKPDALFQGDSFTLNNNGIEIQIVQIVNGNYNIRQVK